MSSSSIITERLSTHPGEVLREEFMRPLGLSASALARALKVPPNRVTSIVAEAAPRAVTPDTALRLARCFGTSPRFWLNLQMTHDLKAAEQAAGDRIKQRCKNSRTFHRRSVGETHVVRHTVPDWQPKTWVAPTLRLGLPVEQGPTHRP